MPLPPFDPLRVHNRPAAAVSSDIHKPPLPTAAPSRNAIHQSHHTSSIEIQIPSLIAGALTGAFATAIADSLDNVLLAHYYLPEGSRVKINLDRVLDDLIATFTRGLWDELWEYYHRPDQLPPPGNAAQYQDYHADAVSGDHHQQQWERDPDQPHHREIPGRTGTPTQQVKMLFDGPIRQIILILNGPETSPCILDKLAPGLSRRSQTWSTSATGIDLSLALQLLCSYYHREFNSQSPGGSPEGIARSLCERMVGGQAAQAFITNLHRFLVSKDWLQMYVVASAMWDAVTRKPYPPPADGFYMVQCKFECDLSSLGCVTAAASQSQQGQSGLLGRVESVTGTEGNFISTPLVEYVSTLWPRSGPLVLQCLEQAVSMAVETQIQESTFRGMSIWDTSEGRQETYCPGLRTLHIEIEEGSLSVSMAARNLTLIDVMQQMSWMCATLGASPVEDGLVEAAVEVRGWEYIQGSILISCGLNHRPHESGPGALPQWLRELRRCKIATGFPVYGSP